MHSITKFYYLSPPGWKESISKLEVYCIVYTCNEAICNIIRNKISCVKNYGYVKGKYCSTTLFTKQ